MKYLKKQTLLSLSALVLGASSWLCAEDMKMPPMKPAPDHGPEAMTMEGFPWLPYELSPCSLWIEATGLSCKRCCDDIQKNLTALAAIESADAQCSGDARCASCIKIKVKKGAALPSDKDLEDALKKAGCTFVRTRPVRVMIAEITGAFSSMCQGVIKSGLMDKYKDRINELAVEISKKGRGGVSWIKIRFEPSSQDTISNDDIQKIIAAYNFKVRNSYMLDGTDTVVSGKPLSASEIADLEKPLVKEEAPAKK